MQISNALAAVARRSVQLVSSAVKLPAFFSLRENRLSLALGHNESKMIWLTSMVVVMNASTALDLPALRYKNRVLLLFALEGVNPALVQQRQWLSSKLSELEARDLKVFEIVGLDAKAQGLRRQFHVSDSQSFSAVLIGKDGTAKLHKNGSVDPEALFRLIDSMPMRQDEMHRSK